MKRFGMKKIRSWAPCYDPGKHLPEDWQGTAIDILNHPTIPFEDQLWCVLRKDLVSERTMRIYAVWCARQAAPYVKKEERPKFHSILDVAHRFAMGEATEEERDAAEDAAWEAACHAVAKDTARATAWIAAWAVVNAVAKDAAGFAVQAAAKYAASAAASAAALAAARDAQKKKLIKMIKAEQTG